MKKVYRVIS